MNSYLTAKVEDGLQPMGSLFGVSMPYSIATVHNRKDVRHKIKDKERAEKRPRQTSQKIDSVRNLRYDMVYMIIPRQGVIQEDTQKLEGGDLLDPRARQVEFKWWWAVSTFMGANEHALCLGSIQLQIIIHLPAVGQVKTGLQ